MTNLRQSFARLASAFTVASALVISAPSANADTWRGTAPFCAGSCNAGERQIGVSDSGDGGYCISGHKVLCSNTAQTCQSKETKTDCYGVVQVCDNGYYESLNTNWHSCDKYACGVCLGISTASLTTLSFQADGCKQGFVWREATKDDHVCVTPATRSQAAAENASAAEHRSPTGGSFGPDTCREGFVWRESVPSDHVCVTPEVRTAAVADNGQAAARQATPAHPYGPDVCKQGFVWREAITNDHVCVNPAIRSQAAVDNGQAAARKSPNGGSFGPDSCKQGFVWREVVPSDHVCVTPETRAATAADTVAAGDRRASK